LKALRQVDRTFHRPAWVGDFFRAVYQGSAAKAATTPRFIDELQDLAERMRAALTT
jgi:hypothetical protein